MTSTITRRKTLVKIWLISVFFILSGFHSYSQLSGTKTINPSGGDYLTFTAAVNALVSQGINGPVTLNVADGTYSEKIRIGNIPGASAVNTVTIQSASADSSKVILTISSTASASNWTLQVDSADYLTIREITIAATGTSYARCVNINGSASNINFENCHFVGYNTTSSSSDYSLIYSTGDQTDKLVFRNNLFSNGSAGIALNGYSTGVLSTGTRILNNVFSDQNENGVWLGRQDGPVINGNIINPLSDPVSAIYVEYCDNAIEIQNNKINLPSGNNGIYMNYCDGTTLNRGKLLIT